jgi:cation transport ATPase
MGVTDSSDVQNIKQQQKFNKTGTLTDGEMQI